MDAERDLLGIQSPSVEDIAAMLELAAIQRQLITIGRGRTLELLVKVRADVVALMGRGAA